MAKQRKTRTAGPKKSAKSAAGVEQEIEKLPATGNDEAVPTLAVFNPDEPAAVAEAYQFKITLKEVDPPIWRRIQVQDCTMETFHVLVQIAMGWENGHMHEFVVGKRHIGEPFDVDIEDETSVRLSDIIPTLGKKKSFEYVYDFGDDWRHSIVFEGTKPPNPKLKHPACIAGERACPPDDIGGPYGYEDFLEAISDPDHDRHEDMLDWMGEFDAEEYDAQAATKEMHEFVRQHGRE